jgi:hypothetical protein
MATIINRRMPSVFVVSHFVWYGLHLSEFDKQMAISISDSANGMLIICNFLKVTYFFKNIILSQLGDRFFLKYFNGHINVTKF